VHEIVIDAVRVLRSKLLIGSPESTENHDPGLMLPMRETLSASAPKFEIVSDCELEIATLLNHNELELNVMLGTALQASEYLTVG